MSDDKKKVKSDKSKRMDSPEEFASTVEFSFFEKIEDRDDLNKIIKQFPEEVQTHLMIIISQKVSAEKIKKGLQKTLAKTDESLKDLNWLIGNVTSQYPIKESDCSHPKDFVQDNTDFRQCILCGQRYGD